jgi:Glu-tRNAGln amidotransferase C subunit
MSRKLVPPHPPNITNASGIDLNEFLGPPGWRLEDLLPPSRTKSPMIGVTDDTAITSDTLHHLLNLSGLPQPRTAEEESNFLSALHDQLHFVRHIQSVPTEGIAPLIRVGNEPDPERDRIGVLSFEECVEESQLDEIPGLEWKPWNVCGLKGGIREGREQGWFVVNDEHLHDDPTVRDSFNGSAEEKDE